MTMTMRSAQDIKSALGAEHISSVRVERVTGAVGTSMEAVAQILKDQSANPQWGAFFRNKELSISVDERGALLAAGATERGDTQHIIIDAVKATAVPCARCNRWLTVGTSRPKIGKCACGQDFEVSTPSTTPCDGQVLRCACCGHTIGTEQPVLRWAVPSGNPHLMGCNACNREHHPSPCWIW